MKMARRLVKVLKKAHCFMNFWIKIILIYLSNLTKLYITYVFYFIMHKQQLIPQLLYFTKQNQYQISIIKLRMMPQQQQIHTKLYREFQNLRKEPFGENLFPQKQIIQLQSFLKAFKQYPRITAIMIQHQHKSIKTLPKQILERFPEFNQRVQKSIGCCKKNSELLQNIIKTLQNNLRLKSNLVPNKSDHDQLHYCGGMQHSHESTQVGNNKILGIFNHLCRQYSEQEIHKKQRFFIQFITQNIGGYLNQNPSMKENLTTLVIGAGMGRTLVQIRNIYKDKALGFSSYYIQGHEEDPEFYLLGQFMLNYHSKNVQFIEIFPYIHNFSNHLKSYTPFTSVKIPLPINEPNLYPLTFGSFHKLYKSHSEQWTIIVTTFYNYSVTDVLLYIQLIYKLLRKGGLWIDVATASFQNHLIPYFSYQEYEKILDKSQFKLIKKQTKDQFWYQEPNKIIKEWRKVHYRVMKKQL